MYTWQPETDEFGPARWTWQKMGHWGLNILDNTGLLWSYLDATAPDEWKEVDGYRIRRVTRTNYRVKKKNSD